MIPFLVHQIGLKINKAQFFRSMLLLYTGPDTSCEIIYVYSFLKSVEKSILKQPLESFRTFSGTSVIKLSYSLGQIHFITWRKTQTKKLNVPKQINFDQVLMFCFNLLKLTNETVPLKFPLVFSSSHLPSLSLLSLHPLSLVKAFPAALASLALLTKRFQLK